MSLGWRSEVPPVTRWLNHTTLWFTVALSPQGSQCGRRLEPCPVPGAAHPSALSALPSDSSNAPLSQKLLLHADGESRALPGTRPPCCLQVSGVRGWLRPATPLCPAVTLSAPPCSCSHSGLIRRTKASTVGGTQWGTGGGKGVRGGL